MATRVGTGKRPLKKWECDAYFLTVMMELVFTSSLTRFQRWLLFHVLSRVYYVAVRVGGHLAWFRSRRQVK